jgi:hypothetical protein
MRHDMSEMEYQQLFVNIIHNFKFSIEELTKMFEARLSDLAQYIHENDLPSVAFKNSKSEMFRSIEGFRLNCESLSDNLKKNIEKSFEKIEGNEKE